ncbi:Cyclin-Y-like protein 2 [Plecturocebus cupreus]
MGNLLTCCFCKSSPESDQDEGSGCPPESEICEAAAEDTTAAAEDTTAAAPTAAAEEPAELTFEAGEGLPVHHICHGEMPQDRDLEADPSDHPEAKKCQADDIALESNPSEGKKSQTDAQEVGENSATNHFSVKFSSCSTIFLESSTASCPDFEITLRSVAFEIYYLIKKRDADNTLDIFDERLFPFMRKELLEKHFICDPTHETILRFMRTLFSTKRLHTDSPIIALVYVKRLMKLAHISLCPTNWKRIIFGAILLVIKFGSNVAVCNKDFCKLFDNVTLVDMDELLQYYLELINYNSIVPSSVYTRYYFYLRDLAFWHGLRLPHYLLDRERAWSVQAFSRMEQDEEFLTGSKNRSLSADDLIRLQHAKAVLS